MDPETINAAIAALDGANSLIGFIVRQIERARERGELTMGQEQEFDAKLATITAQAHWRKR